MGNYSSCFCIHRSNLKTAKLIDSKGTLRQLKLPVKAAELMLEEPGYVVSAAHELLRTGRVIALRAEDEVLARKVYLSLPLCRVNRKISESEMRIIQCAVAVEKMSPKKKSGAKVLPAVAVEVKEEEEEIESEVVGVLEEQDTDFSGCRLANYQRWTPVLEPIFEEPY
ncbi:uncharacterized protein LOC8267358 [Ricinus communis]|uniref:Uncharacterized protein n=1 Tax=Ricinus communis TaxID=3988 RepID=B9RNF9_RICCO|nr:uncharacterized protein LOC8267358 [Ricinus communis]EEF47282.1 conserved hypothetical protein [Ricinus communis]|eukprot:XP_002515298.1 uncharacterized protein LOC8267358 [Ricinus communis]